MNRWLDGRIPVAGHKLIVVMCQVLLIWLVIVATKLPFREFIHNEEDVLPSAKQFVERDWLPNDWYLNLDIGYRHLFNVIFGHIVYWMGFQYGAFVGRLLIYFLLAAAMHVFFQALHLRVSLRLLVMFLFLRYHCLVAGEWIVGGVETKSVAYVFVILACSAFLRKRYLLGFAFAGAAMSFHVLVGLYAMFCTAGALLFNRETYWSEWRTIASRSWAFFVTGVFGLRAVVDQLLPKGNIDLIRASKIYVEYRCPHHLLPTTWTGDRWKYELVLATCLFLAMCFIGRSRASRFVAAYALSSVSLFVLGLVLYILGHIHLLKYLWFRFPDVMIPFIGAVLVALSLNDLAGGRLPFRCLWRDRWHRARLMLGRLAPAVLTLAAALILLHTVLQLQTRLRDSGVRARLAGTQTRPMLEWIAENAPKDAVFLVDPTMSDFYIYAQRALFVSFKHVPLSEADVLEWYERIKLCNGDQYPEKMGFRAEDELQSNFYGLDEEMIWRIAESYGIRYYLGLARQSLPFERVYSTYGFTLYEVDTLD